MTEDQILAAILRDPIALDDFYAVETGATLSIAGPGFIGNDLDPNGGTVTAQTLVDGVDHGTLSATTNGSFTYTAEAGFIGIDSFTYDIVDADGNRATATVFILVYDNPPPVAADDYFSVRAGGTLSITGPGIIGNDLDPDGGTVTAQTLIDGVDHGTLSVTTNGAFTYKPDAGFIGVDSFTYDIVDDEGLRATATVFITVTEGNRAPVAVDDFYAVAAGGTLSLSAPGFVANDVDPDGDTVTAQTLVDGVDHGTLTATTNGAFTYTPEAGFTGMDSFSYDIVDSGGLRSTATVWIAVGLDSDPMAVDDAYVAFTGRTLSVSAPGFIGNDLDAGGGTVSAQTLVDGVDHGTLSALTSGAFTYTPDAGFSGTDSFSYDIVDADGNRDTATVTITVVDARRAPVALDDLYTMRAGETLSVAAAGFIANDIDPDGGTVTAQTLIDGVDHGVLSAVTSGAFTYTPDAGFVGIDSFTYDIIDSDGLRATATVYINVVQGNRPPIGLSDIYATPAGTVLSVDAAHGFTANDVDPDGGTVTGQTLVDDVDHGTLSAVTSGAFTYTPDPGFVGVDSFTYTAVDATGASTGPVTVWIGVYGQLPPQAVDDTVTTDEDTPVTVAVLANDSDPNGDSLTIKEFGQGAHGTVSQLGDMLVYTPSQDFFGSDSFDYVVSDGNGGVDTATVSVTVNPVNDAPVAAADAYAVLSGKTLTVAAPGVLANDTDVENDPLSAALVSGVSHGTLVLAANGGFKYTPVVGFAGHDQFAYAASDGSLASLPAVVDIDVHRREIVGTEGHDLLRGTKNAEIFRPLGGNADRLVLGGGMDIVEFGSETHNGKREITQIIGFSSDDGLDLGVASLVEVRKVDSNVLLTLDGDGDQVLLFDVSVNDIHFI